MVERQVSLAAGFLEKWERDEDAKLVIIKVLETFFSWGFQTVSDFGQHESAVGAVH